MGISYARQNPDHIVLPQSSCLNEIEAIYLIQKVFGREYLVKVSKQAQKRNSALPTLTVEKFLNIFPSIFQPILACLLVYSKYSISNKHYEVHGQLDPAVLLDLVSFWLKSNPCCLLEKSLDLISDDILDQSLKSLFFRVCVLLRYQTNPDSKSYDTRLSKQDSIRVGSQHRTNSFQSGEQERSRLDPWTVVLSRFEALNNLQKEANLDFCPVVGPLRTYLRENLGAASKEQLFAQWIDLNLPNLKPLLVSSFRQLFLNEQTTKKSEIDLLSVAVNCSQVQESIGNSSENLIEHHKDWESSFLEESTLCLTVEACLYLRLFSSTVNQAHKWRLLFASRKNGSSLNRLYGAVTGYTACMILAVSTTNRELFGACIDGPFPDAQGKFYEKTEVFLWGCRPSWKALRPLGKTKNFLFLNTKHTHLPKGLGFGGQIEACRLWISEDLTTCFTLSSDPTFEEGYIGDWNEQSGFSQKHQLKDIEIWGTGVPTAYEAQISSQARDENLKMSRRQIDRKKLWDNDFNRQILFDHTDHQDRSS